MQLGAFDYIFAIAVIFAFLDAFNIGANDCANSFSSSISSRCLKYWQAMILAAICEFLGAVLAGSRVSDTIRSKIIDLNEFESTPAVLMLAMTCALVGSSVWLSLATYLRMPVSTTHSLVGGVIGAGVATIGADHVYWGWSGFAKIVASWFIAPGIAGGFAGCIFLVLKYGILERQNALRNALMLAPVVVFATFSILTMLITWKGAPNLNLDDLSTGATVGSIFGVGGVATIIYLVFIHPFFYRRLVHNDWTLKFYHVLLGPTFYFKSTDDIPPMPEGHQLVVDYYAGRRYDDETVNPTDKGEDVENTSNSDDGVAAKERDLADGAESEAVHFANLEKTETVKESEKELWKRLVKVPSKWPYLFYLLVSYGWRQDVISTQSHNGAFGDGLEALHKRSKYYDIKVEHVFSLLQAFTACTMSFAHGANDISNAAGPLSTVYLVWTSNTIASKADVPIWVLCFCAASLVVGLWLFGYRLMANLGNKLILQSPSRGFCIELGCCVTTVMATRLALPISTTQCAIGATVAVGLCNMDLKTINWRMVAFIYFGWIVTLPCAGLIAGIICGIVLNAPHWGGVYELS
ncbi:hypothetical protein BVG19_g2602 [[Candida] boidinii]|nr:hypothetical protein BVG19_g2602 [[Candida] boidinii]OWB48625.1 hypothetical protein B5S27_g160 [[Candida] boidinii]